MSSGDARSRLIARQRERLQGDTPRERLVRRQMSRTQAPSESVSGEDKLRAT